MLFGLQPFTKRLLNAQNGRGPEDRKGDLYDC